MQAVYADVSETASNRSDNPIPPLVVVTGCDRGVGLWVAVASLQWGFKVLAGVLDQTSPGAQQLLARGAQVTQLDVTRSDDVTRLLGDVMALEDLGDAHLACLVNNAGVLAYAPLEWQRAAHVQHQLRVNLEGLVMVTAALLPLLRRNKGLQHSQDPSTLRTPALSGPQHSQD
ncbi:estradiol 17-beta-dehydrogenase 2-like [Hyalella azteca]|uniref:Estradiol 17-beta-dehydrogenase 2-like n=1 Tax=Hyalella azteca TaxID=294128 RepID=A0A979FKR9_HYAAZ|nr:estradiol 17-beta-dehydrogenase 2-like [Hyalella azteca]